MTAWSTAIPALLVVIAVIFIPGIVVLAAARVRGLALVALAPAVGAAVLAGGAVVNGLVGVPWSVWAAAAWTLFVGALAGVLGTFLRRRGYRAPAPEPRAMTVGTTLGVVVAAFLSSRPLMLGIGRPESVTQTWDGVFHLNALRYIVDTGQASSLELGVLSSPSSGGSYYPAGWHDVVGTAATLLSVPITTVANCSAVVIAGLVWPLSVAYLVRVLVGPHWIAGLAAPVLAVGYVSFPVSLLSFGVLWPTAFANTMIPVAIALLVILGGKADRHCGSAVYAAILFLLVLGGAALTHPSAIFGIILLCLPFVIECAVRWTSSALSEGRRWRVGITYCAAAIVVVALSILTANSSLLASVRGYERPSVQSRSQAVGEALLDATMSPSEFADLNPKWLLATLALTGAVVALRVPRLRWLPASWLVSVVLYAWASGPDSWERRTFTGYWYTDPVRVAALVPLVAAPLAAIGLVFLMRRLMAVIVGFGEPSQPKKLNGVSSTASAVEGDLSAPVTVDYRQAALVAAVLAGIVVATGQLWSEARRDRIAYDYRVMSDGPRSLVSPDELDMLLRLAPTLPDDAVVLGNPFNGSALVYALAGHRVVFPHVNGAWTETQLLLGQDFSQREADPVVCEAIERLGVTHLYTDDFLYNPGSEVQQLYSGLQTSADGEESGLRLVERGGTARVYAVTAC